METQYSESKISYAGSDYPLDSVIRDLNLDPTQPYRGRSIIRASVLTIDLENQMKQWNRGVFARGGHPSMIFNTSEPLSDNRPSGGKSRQFVD